VWRVELAGGPAIVKQIVGGPDAEARFARETTALRLAAGAQPAVAPELIGIDPEARLMVLERLVRDPASEPWAVSYAKALARLHACLGEHVVGLPQWVGPTAADIRAFLRLADGLGISAAPTVTDEISGTLSRLAEFPYDALLHGDPCPDNEVRTGTGLRFVDFERAAIGPGMVELAYLRMAFPTCWCAASIPEPQLLVAEAAYRDTWAAAKGHEPAGSLADACVNWLIRGDSLVEMAHRDGTDHLGAAGRTDWEWGTATARQRFKHRLGVVADVTAGRAELSAVHDVAVALSAQVASRWPDLDLLPPLSTIPF